MSAAQKAAARIRDHMANKTPTRCDPTFMDSRDQWWQVHRYPDLGLTRHDTGPRKRKSDVKREQHWKHDLLSGEYPTLDALLAALDERAGQ